MEFNFKIKGDKLIYGNTLCGNSGNVNTYKCIFNIEEDPKFTWVCIFKKENEAYQQLIENGECVIPKEVLEAPGAFFVGCYGTTEDMRISTNWLEFKIMDGAYCEATTPEEPTPDLWETLFMNSVPLIGENGNWYVYDRVEQKYKDSSKPSRGEKGDKGDKGNPGDDGKDGYTPQRGIDYWTEEDKTEISGQLEKKLNFEERLAKVVKNAGNSLKGSASGEIVTLNDISPMEHFVNVNLSNTNLITYPYYDTTKTVNGITFTDNGDGTITANGTATKEATFMLVHSSKAFGLTKGNKYTLSGTPEGHGSNSWRMIVQNTGFNQNITEGTSVANYSDYYAFIRVEAGAKCENILFKPTLVEGENPREYLPYISDWTEILLNKNGKNLIPYPYYDTEKTVNGITFTVSEDGAVIANGTATADANFILAHSSRPFKLEKGKEYTVSGAKNGDAGLWRVDVQNTGFNQNIQSIDGPKTAVANYSEYYAFIRVAQGAVCNNVTFWPMIEKGSIATNYEIYKKEQYSPKEDGALESILSVYPVTTLSTGTPGVIIDCEYNRDINKVYEELTNAIISLGGNV